MPRRPKYPCGICSYACKSGVLACDDCGQWIHKECIGMSTSLFTRLGDCSDCWYCPSCKSKNNSNKIYTLSFENTSTSSSTTISDVESVPSIVLQPITLTHYNELHQAIPLLRQVIHWKTIPPELLMTAVIVRLFYLLMIQTTPCLRHPQSALIIRKTSVRRSIFAS